jgi:hypothetical protein
MTGGVTPLIGSRGESSPGVVRDWWLCEDRNFGGWVCWVDGFARELWERADGWRMGRRDGACFFLFFGRCVGDAFWDLVGVLRLDAGRKLR